MKEWSRCLVEAKKKKKWYNTRYWGCTFRRVSFFHICTPSLAREDVKQSQKHNCNFCSQYSNERFQFYCKFVRCSTVRLYRLMLASRPLSHWRQGLDGNTVSVLHKTYLIRLVETFDERCLSTAWKFTAQTLSRILYVCRRCDCSYTDPSSISASPHHMKNVRG